MKPKLLALELPEEPGRLARWLEQHLLGPHLGALVAELSAVHQGDTAVSLMHALGGQLADVLASGLGVLPAPALRTLLRQPRLLLALQEVILVRGGPYWDRLLTTSPEGDTLIELGRERLDFLKGQGQKQPAPQPAPARTVLPWYRQSWAVSLTTAAAVLLGVFLYRHFQTPVTRPQPEGWGWLRPGALPEGKPPAQYMNRLADGAAEWFNQQPGDPVALAARIGQLRLGCSVLIFARHPTLPADERDWLRKNCRTWSDELDRQLEALDAGRPPARVQEGVDEIVNRMIAKLRERADRLQAGKAVNVSLGST